MVCFQVGKNYMVMVILSFSTDTARTCRQQRRICCGSPCVVLVRGALLLTLFIGSKTCHLTFQSAYQYFSYLPFLSLSFIDKAVLVIKTMLYCVIFSGYCIFFFTKNTLSFKIKLNTVTDLLSTKNFYSIGSLCFIFIFLFLMLGHCSWSSNLAFIRVPQVKFQMLMNIFMLMLDASVSVCGCL